MSEWTILIKRPHHWQQQLQDHYNLGQLKGGGAMRGAGGGSIAKMPHQNPVGSAAKRKKKQQEPGRN